MTVKALVVYGLGIGCHRETKVSYQLAGAEAELIHFNELIANQGILNDVQVLNLCGGFHHGDILGSAMCAANLMQTSGLTEKIFDFSEKGGVVYGQCNGFQMLVKSGLLPDSQRNSEGQHIQEITLTDNQCGSYRVDFVPHVVAKANHFAFSGLEDKVLYLWCRHGEGRIQFQPDFLKSDSLANVNLNGSVLLSYADPKTQQATEEFPYNPNGSVQGIAGLVSQNQRVIGQMAHPEVSIFKNRRPDWFKQRTQAEEECSPYDIGYQVFKNIVNYFE